MKIVVAGGSGYIGRHLVPALEAAGHEVAILTRRPGRATPPGRGSLVGWDGLHADAGLVAVLDRADAVINLCGVPVGPRPWTPGRRRAILDSRVEPTRTLVEAMAALPAERRPRILVNASGTDRYTGADATPATEGSPPGTGFLAMVGDRWEAAAEAARTASVRVVILRQGIVFGRGAPVLRILALPFRFFAGGPLGDGRQWVSWIHLDDLVGLYLAVIADDRCDGPVNAVAPEPVPQAMLAAAIGHALHRPARLRTPAWLLRLILGEQSTIVLGSRRAVPARALALGYRYRRADLDAALADALGG